MGRCASEFTMSDQLIKITQTESGALPVMTFLQCHAPLFPNKLQRIMYS